MPSEQQSKQVDNHWDWEGYVTRPLVRMLNGAGPVNPPLRTLYVDGSDESRKAFELCREASFDFAVEIVDPGTQVFLYDGFVHLDFKGLDEIKKAVARTDDLFADLREIMNIAVIGSPLRPNPATKTATEAQREAAERRMQQAVLNYAALSK